MNQKGFTKDTHMSQFNTSVEVRIIVISLKLLTKFYRMIINTVPLLLKLLARFYRTILNTAPLLQTDVGYR